MRGNEQVAHLITNAIPTGSLSLDLALGVGGLPRGRVTEIYGSESAGKSTLAIHIMTETQRMGGLAAYVDAEHALDPQYAANCGLDIDNLLISQPDSAEQALDITEKLVSSGAIDSIVIDSVAALVPQAEIEGDMGDVHVGMQARLMSQALRKLTAAINRSRTAEEGDLVARLVDLTAGSSHEEEEAVIPLDEVAEQDVHKVCLGSIFRWVIGYERSAAGTKKRVSQIVFRDLPAIAGTDSSSS